MNNSNKKDSFFSEEFPNEIQKMVNDSIRNTSDALLKALNLTKKVTSQKPKQKIAGMELAENWAQFNLQASKIVSRHSKNAINEILDAFEKSNILESPPKKPSPQARKRKTQPRATQAKK